ncbi:MAG: malonyl-ACP O-methyltransferase BioC [Betaproteobacteria bacterium]|jgi:malonyl-CoA O-methyltransferase|nr:malonyl-ACP O-methyltransferase BioC [Betaproteobacteria bacterium]
MSAAQAIDKRAVRRSFDRAAAGYDAAAVLQQEVCARSLERLAFIKHQPLRILDAGCGTGNAWAGLGQRFPRAELIALDLAPAMLRTARSRLPWHRRWLGRVPAAVCGDLEALPLKAASIDLLWSNLALQWVNDLPAAFRELRRVLVPGGLLMFATFGPDTLKELRAAQPGPARGGFNRFTDMHDIGDMLVAAGFADPVIDMEPFTLTYENVRAVMHDLKAIGAHSAAVDRPVALAGKSWLAALERNYEAFRRHGRLPATFEVIYGHAWAPLPRRGPGGRPVIEIRTAGGGRL